MKERSSYSTGSGKLETKYKVEVNFILPEFSTSTTVSHDVDLIEEGLDFGYDMVIGRDIMKALNIDLKFSNGTIVWDELVIPMKEYYGNDDTRNLKAEEVFTLLSQSAEPIATKEMTKRMVEILDASYEKADLKEVCQKATNLAEPERDELYKLLIEFEDLFDGTLGRWKTEPAKAELREGAKPVYQRHYPIPNINREAFRTEIKRLVDLKVLEPVAESQYGSPAFIVPKPDRTVRFVTDFRRVNATVKRKPFPIPRIGETLQSMQGFTWASTLDLSMGYWTIELDPETKDMTTITTEFGKFRYNVLPMGFVISSDVFQAKVMELLGHINGLRCYLDDVLAMTCGTFAEHLQQLRLCFEKLREAGLKVNIKKCNFGVTEVKYLGYIITREGIKPDPKKIQAIVDLARPTTVTDMKGFLGMVQFYRDMWQGRSHMLHPLIEACKVGKGKTPIQWSTDLNNSFEDVKRAISKETLLSYPDWNKKFTIHTDSSDYQLGAVISQNGKPIAFFSRRLTAAQKNYTTTEKELLAIVECLKQYRNILQGYPIEVFTDHKNLMYTGTLSESQRVMRWRMILEEFGPTIHHLAGADNVVADALSRLLSNRLESTEGPSSVPDGADETKEMFATTRREAEDTTFPLAKYKIQNAQTKELNKKNSDLKRFLSDPESGFRRAEVDDVELVLYRDKIYIPAPLRTDVLHWYHHYLNHPGGDRLGKTIAQTCYWKGMLTAAKAHVKSCKVCNELKPKRHKYGHLPPKQIGRLTPWKTVHVDLIGPYAIHIRQVTIEEKIIEKEVKLMCMTMIDPASGWFEIAEVPSIDIEELKSKGNHQLIDKTSRRISQVFNQVWLSRYPRPEKVIFDNGSEFKKDFLVLLKDFDIKPSLTTVKNPQGNSPVERIHQVIGHMLLTKDLENQTYDLIDPFGEILSSIAWAIRSSYHSTLHATPGEIVFGRDMIFNMKVAIDWDLMQKNKEQQIIRDNIRENLKRIDYDYKVGDKVMVLQSGVVRKLDRRKKGPFRITQVFTNGNVMIQRGITQERINIRRIEPVLE